MSFTAPELIQLPHGHLGGRVGGGGYGKGDKHLVHVQPRIVVAKVIHLQILYGLYHYGGYEVHILLYPAQALERVEQHGSRSAKELSGLAGDYFAIGQCTPGVIAVNTATFIGQKQRGIAGGIVATLGVVFPSLVIISALAGVIAAFSHLTWVAHAFAGVRVCVCVLIFNAVLKLMKSSMKDAWGIAIFAVIFVLSILTNLSPVIYVVAAALAGVLIQSLKAGGAKK